MQKARGILGDGASLCLGRATLQISWLHKSSHGRVCHFCPFAWDAWRELVNWWFIAFLPPKVSLIFPSWPRGTDGVLKRGLGGGDAPNSIFFPLYKTFAWYHVPTFICETSVGPFPQVYSPHPFPCQGGKKVFWIAVHLSKKGKVHLAVQHMVHFEVNYR